MKDSADLELGRAYLADAVISPLDRYALPSVVALDTSRKFIYLFLNFDFDFLGFPFILSMFDFSSFVACYVQCGSHA
jgi:hypothetical protein